MSATKRNTTPAARLMSKKATVSNAIQKARARLPIIVNFFGNSMGSLIFSLPVGSYCLKKDKKFLIGGYHEKLITPTSQPFGEKFRSKFQQEIGIAISLEKKNSLSFNNNQCSPIRLFR